MWRKACAVLLPLCGAQWVTEDKVLINNGEEVKVTWSEPHDSGNLPPPLTGHTATLWRNKVFVHGGFDERGVFREDIWVFDTDKQRWLTPTFDGRMALARSNHAAALLQDKLFIFGGNIGQMGMVNSMPVLDLATKVWSRPTIFGKQPPPVAGHTLTAVGDKLYLIGGRDGTVNCLEHVFIFDPATMTWARHFFQYDLHHKKHERTRHPNMRMHHTATPVGKFIYLVAGAEMLDAQEYPINDVWMLDTEAMEWLRPAVGGVTLPNLIGHSTTLYHNKLVVFGGFDGSKVRNDVYVLDLDKMVWTRTTVDDNSGVPKGRRGHSATVIGPQILVFGGDDALVAGKARYEQSYKKRRNTNIIYKNEEHISDELPEVYDDLDLMALEWIREEEDGSTDDSSDALHQNQTETDSSGFGGVEQ